jgi:hypothetical protein
MRSGKVPQPIPGAPNFRTLPGMPVFGTGMPTIDGITAVLRVRRAVLCMAVLSRAVAAAG